MESTVPRLRAPVDPTALLSKRSKKRRRVSPLFGSEAVSRYVD
jgi:hypothetical protein